jgi:hypothetical protein
MGVDIDSKTGNSSKSKRRRRRDKSPVTPNLSTSMRADMRYRKIAKEKESRETSMLLKS